MSEEAEADLGQQCRGDSSVVDHLAGPAVLPKKFNLIGKGWVASDASGLK